jgi:hypothetical protein
MLTMTLIGVVPYVRISGRFIAEKLWRLQWNRTRAQQLVKSSKAELPTASAVRYKNVRCKPMKRFSYLITFTIDEAALSVNILQVFSTYQEPLH